MEGRKEDKVEVEKMICWYCGEAGHWKRNCPKMKCFYCNENHMKKNCIKHMMDILIRKEYARQRLNQITSTFGLTIQAEKPLKRPNAKHKPKEKEGKKAQERFEKELAKQRSKKGKRPKPLTKDKLKSAKKQTHEEETSKNGKMLTEKQTTSEKEPMLNQIQTVTKEVKKGTKKETKKKGKKRKFVETELTELIQEKMMSYPTIYELLEKTPVHDIIYNLYKNMCNTEYLEHVKCMVKIVDEKWAYFKQGITVNDLGITNRAALFKLVKEKDKELYDKIIEKLKQIPSADDCRYTGEKDALIREFF